jgi:two-component system chemotaxis response regulator CheB
MSRHPRPVIMLSAFTYEGAITTFDCLSCGALDFIWKTSKSHKDEFCKELQEKVLDAARIQLAVSSKPRISKSLTLVGADTAPAKPAHWLVVLGAGEGGYHTTLKIIPYIPKNIPCALVLVGEMPEELTHTFVQYLDQWSKIVVKRVEAQETLQEGVCYVTNHTSPVCIGKTSDGCWQIARQDGQSTSENVLRRVLSSVASSYGHKSLGIVLTGHMPEAIYGFRHIKAMGGMVIAQDPNTCLKADAAKTVIQEKLADKIVIDVDIPSVLWYLLKKSQEKEARKSARVEK